MKNILIFSERDFSTAPRVIREINALSKNHRLFLAGRNPELGRENYTSIYRFFSLRDRINNRFGRFLKKNPIRQFSRLNRFLVQKKIEVVIIHEPEFLPLFVPLRKSLGFKLVFNAHEYHPLEFEDIPGWTNTEGKVYYNLYRNYLRETDLFINVCESIRLKCLSEFNVDSIVLPNAASYKDLPVCVNNTLPLRLIHHGTALSSRKIERMIELAEKLGPNYQMDLMLTVNADQVGYFENLKELASKVPNVNLIQPVKFENICSTLNRYDIGVFYLEPTNFNYAHALPNKLFEFIQARLAIAISPSAEMKALVEKHNLGVISDNFEIENLANKIKRLSMADVSTFKLNSEMAAHSENAETYGHLFLDHFSKL